MSLKQHLEKKVKEMRQALEQQHGEELKVLEDGLKKELASLEDDYKRMVENEVNLRVAQKKFELQKTKRFKLEKLQKEQVEKVYQDFFQKVVSNEGFLTKFVEAFFKKVESLDLGKDCRVVVYGENGKLLHEIAKKKSNLPVEEENKNLSSSGIKLESKEIEVNYNLNEVLTRLKELSIHEVFVALFG